MSHPVLKHLKHIPGRFFQVFDDWLELMVQAHVGYQEGYLQVVRRYGPREEGKIHAVDHFAHALGTVMGMMQDENGTGIIRDHLGEIYEQEGLGSEPTGQFFSPMALCELMAAITMQDVKDHPRITIHDPACGSGRMFLACLRHTALTQVTFHGIDRDRTCAKMAALNMMWRNASSVIIWGDTLRLKANGGWLTRHTFDGGELHEMPVEVAQERLENSVRRMAAQPDTVIANAETKAEIKQTVKTREGKHGQGELDFDP